MPQKQVAPRPFTAIASFKETPSMDYLTRPVPDVPEDVDFVMQHLNDPNYDLTQSRPPSFSTIEKKEKDIDAESQFDSDHDSTVRSVSIAADFDEYVYSAHTHRSSVSDFNI